MQTIAKGYRGLSLLIDVNWDRVLFPAAIAAALWAGAVLGQIALS